MFFGIALIAILAVMGGAIAYIGDKLGTKVGKRKLTIFHLRPKYTSIIVTIVTGICIATATIGVLALTVKDARTALFGMETLKGELSSLSHEVTAQNAELAASRSELEAKNAEYKALTDKITQTGLQLTNITNELAGVTAQRDRVSRQLSEVQADYASARGDLDKAGREITTLQAIKQQLDDKVTTLNTSKKTLEADVGRLHELTDNLKQGIIDVRKGAIAFRAGEVLYTTTFSPERNKDNIKGAFNNLVAAANASLLERVGATDKNAKILVIPQADFDQAVAVLSSSPKEMVVRISSVGNTVYGEFVIAHIELYENRLVYHQGDVIYSEIVNAGATYQDSENTVIAFLMGKVNAEAVKSGVLPDPLRGSVGVIRAAQVFDVANKVQKYSGGKVQLTVVATQDIFTEGPLGQLTIDIRVRAPD